MPGDFTFTAEVVPICELGMSDVAQAEPDSWLDISCHVHEAELFRGRERFNDRFQPGTATITFSNDDGWADLVGDYSAVELQQLRPGRPIRVGVRGPFGDGGAIPTDPPPVVTRWLWRGYIDQATPAYDPVLHDIVSVSCIDALGEAGMRQLLGSPLVGVNEAVGARLNRVLDARGWWPGKRVIAAGTALLQGTRLEGSTTDLLTAPADSAGGIVYGDTDGNVAYKDIDWELYDPDTPPDGEIGNCEPGLAPSTDTPPYLDPTLGPPPYDPDPPAPTHPAETHFCVGQSDDTADGVIIERGEAYMIFVDKPPGTPEGATYQPHLYLTENGNTYDLGEWPVEGGCTTITHPTTTTAPTRQDDPKPTDPTPPTITGDLLPPGTLFGVELLGYSDGGIADGPQSTVTVAGITPGPDRLLVVLVCALRTDITAGGLTPFPSAGGSITATGDVVTFDEIAREPSGSSGAESYGAAGRTGRTDPGTFDVVVDWAGVEQSREHIATVWGVSAERADLLDRMRFGAYLRSFTWDRTVTPFPSPNPPGKGFWQTAFEDTGSDDLPYPRLQDIAIAQSLAESPTAPFGASFNTVDGDWWTPEFADAALLAAGAVFSDDFERADGALGDDWVRPASLPSGGGGDYLLTGIDTAADFGIQTGAAVGPKSSASPRSAAISRYVNPIDPAGGQFVEIAVTGLLAAVTGAVGDVALVYVYLMLDDSTFSGVGLEIIAHPTDGARLRMYQWESGTGADFSFDARLAPSDDDIVARMEVTPVVGVDTLNYLHARLLVDGVEVMTYDFSQISAPGSYIGMSERHFGSSGLPTGPTPRIESVSLGAAGGGIVRKCSWVAGYRGPLRPGFTSAPDVKFDEVNFGPDDIQSCQACVVVEPLWPDQFGWRALAHYERAPVPPTTLPPGSHSSTVRYERNSIIVVFVSAFAAGTAGISIASSHGLTFHEAVAQGPVAPSHGQGAAFWAKTPELALAADDPDVVTVTWTTTLEGVNYLIEEVTNGGTIGATASAARGTHALGSVDGGVTLSLSPAPPTSSLVLGFIGVAGEPTETGVTAGADFVEEIQVLPPGEWTYLQEQSRVGSTSTLVNWVDMSTSTPTGPQASDAVALAVEVTPGPDYVNWETEGPLVIGGNNDAFNGPIYSATERDAAGTVIWSFDPVDYV